MGHFDFKVVEMKLQGLLAKSPFGNDERLTTPIFDECQTQSARVLALRCAEACQDDSNDPPIFFVSFKSAIPIL